MRSRAVTTKKCTKQCAVRAEMLFCISTTFLFYFLSLFIYLSFFLFDVLESSLSGTLQNNEGDGNGNIKTIANT